MRKAWKFFLRDKRYVPFVILLILLLYCVLHHSDLYPFRKPESYYNVFGTIAKSFGAILGLTGAYTIFMINSFDTRIFNIGQSLITRIREAFQNREFHQASLDDYLLEPAITNHFANNNTFNGNKHEFLALKRYRIFLVISGIYIATLLSLILIANLILLPYSESLLTFHNDCGMNLVLLMILISIWGLIETVMFIYDVIKNVTDI